MAVKSQPIEYKAEDLVNLIRFKYATEHNGYNPCVVLEQVPDGTGFAHSHWIDVAVFQMWHSKGLSRSAFEIKISRSDVLNELSHPEKHQWCLDCFHQFWIVAPKQTIQIEELPARVGWMYPRGGKLCVARHAVPNPTPRLDDALLAGFMRAAYKGIQESHKNNERSILDNSREYQTAKWYMEATLKFLESRNVLYLIPNSANDVQEALEQATMDKQLKQERDNLLSISGRFQRDIASLLNLFLIIAHKSLVARDEMGKLIVKQYGGEDTEGLAILKEVAKNSKSSNHQKQYAELIELLLNWEGIQHA